MRRRGVTLPELLLALSLFGMVGTLVVVVLRRTEDATRLQAQQIDVRQNLRIAAGFFPIELRELDASDEDLVVMGPTALTIRAQRQLAVLCRPPVSGLTPGSLVLTIRDTPRAGLRDFNPAGDSLLILSDGDPGTPDDDAWAAGSFGPLAADFCPDGSRGRRFTATFRPLAGRTGPVWGITSGAPVLGFEIVGYRLYRSSEDNRWYIGQQIAGDLQPVLGPVTSDGLAFTYLDSGGVPVSERARVAMIGLRVLAPTARRVRDAQGRLGQPLDSVVAVVWLRNNRRF